jgi:hypothetical protein
VPRHTDGQTTVFNGSGYGEQYPFVVPEHDIIVVFNGWNIHERGELSAYAALWERILPAVREQP